MYKHGHSTREYKSPTYRSWLSMIDRCCNSNNPKYEYYGGRGIKVCDRWKEFTNFLNDMGKRPSLKVSIDRYPDKNGNYELENCRWSSDIDQQRNMRSNDLITYNGEIHCRTEWAEIIGITPDSLRDRLRQGWTIERALTTECKRVMDRHSYGGSKECCRCEKIKSITEFSKCKKSKDGLQSYCLECHKLYMRKYRS
jgi:hypothetical protein